MQPRAPTQHLPGGAAPRYPSFVGLGSRAALDEAHSAAACFRRTCHPGPGGARNDPTRCAGRRSWRRDVASSGVGDPHRHSRCQHCQRIHWHRARHRRTYRRSVLPGRRSMLPGSPRRVPTGSVPLWGRVEGVARSPSNRRTVPSPQAWSSRSICPAS